MKYLTILGSTGSIGTQTLDVVRHNPKDFQIIALCAGENAKLMKQQIDEFSPRFVVMKDEINAEKLARLYEGELPCSILYGMEGLIEVATDPVVDIVVAAMVGMIGLQPVMRGIEAGKDIALANKETLVTAGHLIMPLAKKHGVHILPVDSEHSAIFQCLHGNAHEAVSKIYLTASGGPFRDASLPELSKVTVSEALAHPNWSMGKKITIDSATMINKGLEIIEAKWLFGVDIDQIHVLVQPQSIIHSMVEYRDGAVMAQLGAPDMRLPIQYALYYPDRVYLDGERLDFDKITEIHFEKPHIDTLRGIPLAIEASQIGGSMPTVMNAADEYAVARFLQGDIGFLQIYDMIEYAMRRHQPVPHPDLSQILDAERETYDRLRTEWRNISV